jgi:hypothetical protein
LLALSQLSVDIIVGLLLAGRRSAPVRTHGSDGNWPALAVKYCIGSLALHCARCKRLVLSALETFVAMHKPPLLVPPAL